LLYRQKYDKRMDPTDGSPSDGQTQRERLARNVRKAREYKQLSLAALEEKTGLTREFLEALERGAIEPSVTTLGDLERLAGALGVECADLFAGSV
jgi:transcriptional regulator with XRE-family HTH domain